AVSGCNLRQVRDGFRRRSLRPSRQCTERQLSEASTIDTAPLPMVLRSLDEISAPDSASPWPSPSRIAAATPSPPIAATTSPRKVAWPPGARPRCRRRGGRVAGARAQRLLLAVYSRMASARTETAFVTFLRANRGPILAEWERRVRARPPGAEL